MQRLATILVVSWAVIASAATPQAGETNTSGIEPGNFDKTCSPCKDFFQYSNGTWLANNPIPDAYSTWSVWNEMRDRNNEILRSILEEAAADDQAEQGSNRQKIGDFYHSAMNDEQIETEGVNPLGGDFERIAALSTVEDLQALIASYHSEGLTFLFSIDIDQDLKNSEKIIFYAQQGGLGLPDRDYYIKDDEDSEGIRKKYVEHVANMLSLLGDNDELANSGARRIMEMETRLAHASLTRVELRDPNAYYNILSIDSADASTTHFSWSKYLEAMGMGQLEDFSFAHPKFFAEMDALLAETSVEDWKNYLRWHLISSVAPYLSTNFVNEDFGFYSTTLRGTKELRPRWKRVLSRTNRSMGEALGQLYVERAFPPAYKARCLEMVNNLRGALKERLINLEWMGGDTKALALHKLSTFTPKIGYPDKWRDYSTLNIDRGSYVDNVRRSRQFEMQRNLNKIGKPVDRAEWGMSPQTINAYYNPLKNEIVFPAGILQPPFFDGEIDDAVNYGAMGAIIGHELMHGFDDQGSKFDADGNMKDWWTEEDRDNFEKRTERLVNQFAGYEAVDGLMVNGELTLGENIGDLGGIIIAYKALEHALEGKQTEQINDFTPQQRFFLSWSQAWRVNFRPEALKLRVKTDPHSPGMFRANGPLSNLTEFHDAFGCKDGDEMVMPDSTRVQIW